LNFFHFFFNILFTPENPSGQKTKFTSHFIQKNEKTGSFFFFHKREKDKKKNQKKEIPFNRDCHCQLNSNFIPFGRFHYYGFHFVQKRNKIRF